MSSMMRLRTNCLVEKILLMRFLRETTRLRLRLLMKIKKRAKLNVVLRRGFEKKYLSVYRMNLSEIFLRSYIFW